VGRLALALLLAGVLWACRSTRRGGDEEFSRAPPPDATPGAVLDALRLLRDLRGDDAVARLERDGGIAADAPERSWLLADLRMARFQTARARAEADALPEGAFADVLRAHVARDPAKRLRLVSRHRSGPAAGWANLETAIVLAEEGDQRTAVRTYASRAAALGPAYVRREALLLVARAALADDDAREALATAETAGQVDPEDARAPALASRAAARLGRLPDAMRHALDALRRQPRSARAARRVADLVREDPGSEAEAAARETLAALLARPGASAEARAASALLAERAGETDVAIADYEYALVLGCDPVPVERHLRRLLVAVGRRAQAVRLLRRAVPPECLSDPRNLRLPAWEALAHAAARVPDGASPDVAPDALVHLAEALRGVGALEDAVLVARSADSDAGRALARRLEGHLSFERAMRDALEAGYRAVACGASPPGADALRRRILDLADAHLVPDEAAALRAPDPGVRTVPFLGTWLDHSTDTTSPLVAHFRRHGRFLILGQRHGQPPEAILLSLASLTRSQPIPTQGRVLSHDVAVGYDREIRSYLDHQGGALSGAALPDGVWLDADASRREEHSIRAAVAAEPSLLAAAAAAGADPPVPDGPDGPLALDDPAGVALRLARRYVERTGNDPWGTFRALAAHEFGHVLDLARHLPVGPRLPATLRLLASQGFAFERVEARLEEQAQLAAIADAPDPDLALVSAVSVLPLVERTPEAHDRGYRDLSRRFVAFVAANPGRFPAIDGARKVLPQLDRLTPDEIRSVARTLIGLEPLR
jgi:tetratricopeptide (TPR) repeat protein